MTYQPQPFPIVRVMCLLVGCLVTLIGVALNLNPEVVLFRVAVAVVATGILVAAARSITRTISET